MYHSNAAAPPNCGQVTVCATELLLLIFAVAAAVVGMIAEREGWFSGEPDCN